MNQLHANIGTGLAVLQAPTGYGKTALVAQFCSEVDYAVRWLSLDPSSAATDIFAIQLAETIAHDRCPGEPPGITRVDDLKAYLDVVLRRARESFDLPLLLVLDNVEELKDAEDSADLLGWLLEALPEESEVILSGREPVALSTVDRRVAAGECLWLGAEDLAFTQEEIAALIEDAARSDLTAGEVFQATHGWPTGVMAVLAGTVTVNRASARRTSGAWERFVAAEVWERVPRGLRDPLLRLSVAPDFNLGLAQELVGPEGARDVFGWLNRNAWLAEQLPGEVTRLNPLLRRFLVTRFEQEDPEGFADVVARVARSLEREGRPTDAIELARTSHQLELLADILERQCSGAIFRGASASLARAFETIRPEMLDSRPLLRAHRARVLAEVGHATEAKEDAEQLLGDESLPGTVRLHALLAKVRAHRFLGEIEEVQKVFDSVRAMPECDDPAVLGELAYHEANFAVSVAADYARGERLLRTALDAFTAGGSKSQELLARSTLGHLLSARGKGPAAVEALTAAARGWRELGGTSNLGWVLNNLGMAHLLVGDFKSAVTVLEEAIREGKTCENQRNLAYATASLGDAELALGRYSDARAHYEEAIKICSEDVLDDSLASLSITGLSAALLGEGDLQQADYFAERAALIAETFSNPFDLASVRLQQAMVASASKQHAKALQRAREAVEIFAAIDAQASLRVAQYRLAMCLFRAGQRDEAQQALEELAEFVTEPWMTGVILPAVREDPMFAQWASSRRGTGDVMREFLRREVMVPAEVESEEPERPAVQGTLPPVKVMSLGRLSIMVGGIEVSPEAWTSQRAAELFFIFLSNRGGVRKEEAVARLYPDLTPEKCNSAFHSNLYRIRRALYQDSIVRQNGMYLLNPEGEFCWDVEEFENAVEHAREEPAGSAERAERYRQALEHYRGPFAESFHGEWAEALRQRVEDHAQEALSSLAGYLAARGEYETAVSCLERLLSRDPFNDEAAYSIARYRVLAGQSAAALAFMDEYRRTYERELGTPPPDRFDRLRTAIAAGEAV
ncbi:MAG: hypothetical protein Kow0010_10280 [Dehalococcoidia bacterium]